MILVVIAACVLLFAVLSGERFYASNFKLRHYHRSMILITKAVHLSFTLKIVARPLPNSYGVKEGIKLLDHTFERSFISGNIEHAVADPM
jgi:hypothetical protein